MNEINESTNDYLRLRYIFTMWHGFQGLEEGFEMFSMGEEDDPWRKMKAADGSVL